MSLQGPHFSAQSTAKTNDKSTNLRKNGISDVVNASVYTEKTRLKKLMKIIIIFIIARNDVFSWVSEFDFRYEKSDGRLKI